jgi:hypothetical protein
MSEKELRQNLYGAFKNRALMYYHIFDELRKQVGEKKAEVLRCDKEALDLKFHGCPLRDAWQEAGLSDKETETICSIAAAVDIGTFEGAGFEFSAETWKPEFGSSCFLHIRPGKKAKKPAKKTTKKSRRYDS